MSGVITAWVAIGTMATATAVSYSQGRKQEKAIKNAAADAQAANDKAIAEAKLAQETAGSQAEAQIQARRRRISDNQTIFTSPMGITEQATTAKKALLGQ